MTHISEISAIFGMEELGLKELPFALFYHCGFGLRFELAPSDCQRGGQILSFIQAWDRATTILAAIMPDQYGEDITAFISQPGDKRVAHAKRRLITELRPVGIDVSTLDCAGMIAQEDQYHIANWGEDRYRHWFTLDITSDDEIEKIAWACVAKDSGIDPSLRSLDIYLVDKRREIAVHIYDDQGMDIIANDLDHLRSLYNDLNDFILIYDREHIDEVFKTGRPHRWFDAKAAFEHRQSPPPGSGIHKPRYETDVRGAGRR